MFLFSSCSCICATYWSQMLRWQWRCSWSSADRRCSNYIWVINNFIAHQGATYIRGLTVIQIDRCYNHTIACQNRASVSPDATGIHTTDTAPVLAINIMFIFFGQTILYRYSIRPSSVGSLQPNCISLPPSEVWPKTHEWVATCQAVMSLPAHASRAWVVTPSTMSYMGMMESCSQNKIQLPGWYKILWEVYGFVSTNHSPLNNCVPFN